MERTIDLAFSPCPNDTFIFHAMLHGCIETAPLRFAAYIDDVESLNRAAMEGMFPVTKLSFFACMHLKSRYELLDAGAALGYGCGPILVAKAANVPLTEARIAVPGTYTTANLLLRLWHPGALKIETVRFDEILPGIDAGRFDAGVIIHEGRFVYPDYHCVPVVDLGQWWEAETGLPIPLGCIAIRKDEPTLPLKRDIERMLRDSVRYAFAHPEASRGFVKAHAQEMDDGVIESHIRLYVNDFTLSLGTTGRKAIETLEEMARCRGLL